MNSRQPSVTVLIAARPGQADVKAAVAARELDYPGELLEIIVARGRQPSVQRNAGMREARGELIYFLDDDSVPARDNLKRIVEAFADERVEMVGGPNLCPADAPMIEQIFALVHSSWLAFFSSRSRYASVGLPRQTSEKELILCNLVARKKSMIDLGGFNEALYPNEENALMDELQKRGGRLMYDPNFIVYRRPRNSLKAFAKMLMNYGRGRAEQFRLHPTLGSAPNFVPPMFCLYLLLLAGLLCARKINWLLPAAIPLGFYGVAVLLQAAALIPGGGVLRAVGAIPLIALTHVLYGAGFWRGLTTRLKKSSDRPATEVKLERLGV